MNIYRKVIVIGLDGLEPRIVERLLDRGELPNLARLRRRGGYAPLATTLPAQTPVAWATFATGTNPGGHGVFDFLRRDPETNLPDAGLFRFEQKNAFVPPRAVNMRRGTPLWQLLSAAGISSTVLRCPCTFPPDEIRGRMLSGLGVPDLRGSFGSATFFTSAATVAGEGEYVVPLDRRDGPIQTRLPGPRSPRGGENVTLDLTLVPNPAEGSLAVSVAGQLTVTLWPGRWSGWVRVKFKTGMFQTQAGAVRFLLTRLGPELELYASPIQLRIGDLLHFGGDRGR